MSLLTQAAMNVIANASLFIGRRERFSSPPSPQAKGTTVTTPKETHRKRSSAAAHLEQIEKPAPNKNVAPHAAAQAGGPGADLGAGAVGFNEVYTDSGMPIC